ncbi:NAD-dependent epimerase/dehydratase family protein [Allofournierella sp.]|uniref:NAD-dependent epimerase/dehydratase family protein n=1 Tax=Allofournierella sp. TaxID=1940256 RepID=UPI003AB860F4
MKRIFVITGVKGHLGAAIARILAAQGEEVRGLALAHDRAPELPGVRYIEGDVRDLGSLRPLFEDTGGAAVEVIHAAGLVDVSGGACPDLEAVNVQGTANVLALCRRYGARRLVYVSSVHAIPEQAQGTAMREVSRFSAARVTGAYAKTKAAATQLVLDAAAEGLDAVVVHPSGILGPGDEGGGNHLVQMVRDYLAGRLPACVAGGYDLVDVRDVAQGCLLALEKGKKGECYILSNQFCSVKNVLELVRHEVGGRRLAVMPMWLARGAAPFFAAAARRRHQRPLYTAYSLYTLRSNGLFCHEKAARELGYRPRPLAQTVRDTALWLQERAGAVQRRGGRRAPRRPGLA